MSNNPSDTELLRAARDGDVTAVGALIQRHRVGMRAVALSLLGNRPDAEDAVRDASLIALRRIGDVRQPESVGAWLRVIVRNVSRSRLRSTVSRSTAPKRTSHGSPRPAQLCLDRPTAATTHTAHPGDGPHLQQRCLPATRALPPGRNR
ncbi:RNA polymerase sigma factor [Streptomyces avermitilis]